MHPIIGHVGRYAIPSHEFFVFLGTVAAAVVFLRETRRRGLVDERLLWIIAGTLIAGAIGAKLATVWRYVALSGDHSLEGMLLRGGRSILGGLAGAYVGAIATKKLVGYTRSTGDLFAPAVALGHGDWPHWLLSLGASRARRRRFRGDFASTTRRWLAFRIARTVHREWRCIRRFCTRSRFIS